MAVGPAEAGVAGRPHLVLADVRDERRVVAGGLADPARRRSRRRAGRCATPRSRASGASRTRRASSASSREVGRALLRRDRLDLRRSAPRRTRFTSPTIGTSTATFLPISAGSMSTWTIRAYGAKVGTWPVTRSSKRMPRAISRSADWIALLTCFQPCMPTKPRLSGWVSSIAPTPSSVWATGIWAFSASSRSSSVASEIRTPWPARMTGRFGRGDLLGRELDLAVVALEVRLEAGQVDGRRGARPSRRPSGRPW